ncbi:MAG: pre-peptidase C-terminal domain-containing protein [Planctomycetota bacterium]
MKARNARRTCAQKRRPSLRRPLRVESLEARQLLTADLPQLSAALGVGSPDGEDYVTSSIEDVAVQDGDLGPALPAALTVAAQPFFRLDPAGGLVSTSQGNAGSLVDAADEMTFEFYVEAGETVAAVVRPSEPMAVLTVQLGAGASATASEAGEAAVLGPVVVGASGVASLRVTGNRATAFMLDIYRNAALEASLGDSGLGNPLSVDASELALGSSRYAVVGTAEFLPTVNVVFQEDFDGPTQTFTFDNDYGSGNGLWHVSTGRGADGLPNHSPPRSLYFGQNETPTLEWDARLDTTLNSTWESGNANTSDTQWSFAAASNPVATSGGSLATITKTYTLPPAATMSSIETALGDAVTDQDASWELVFRPSNFTGNHVLFETGGNGDGLAFLLLGDTLEFRVQDGDSSVQRVVRSFTFSPEDVGQFHHVVATVHPALLSNENAVRFFVDGTEVGTASSAIGVLADWAGTNGSGLGNANSDFPDSDATSITGDFDGDIAIIRFFGNRLLDEVEVAERYSILANGGVVPGSYGTGTAVGGRAVTPAIALPSTGTLTLSFDTLIDVEDAPEGFEIMRVLLVNTVTQGTTVLLDRYDSDIPNSSGGEWITLTEDVTAFAGQNVQFIFEFDTGDADSNDFEGWYIDNVQVTQSLPATSSDEDVYSFSSEEGQTIDVVISGLAGADFAGQLLEILSPDGLQVLATGSSNPLGVTAANFDVAVLGFNVPASGQYLVRLTPGIEGEYSLVVTESLIFESEPNGAGDPLRSLDASGAGVGYLRTAAIETFSDRTVFVASNPGLANEDFEEGNVLADDVAEFFGPLSSATNNAVFSPGEIQAGLTISAQNNNGSTPGAGDLVVLGSEFFGPTAPGSKIVGANEFVDDTVLTFTGGVTGVGFDLFEDTGIDVAVTVRDALNNVLLSTTVTASSTGTFFGVASNTAIAKIVLASAGGELVDNVTFGATSLALQPDGDRFTFTATEGEAVVVSTATPFDDPSNLPLNDLDPRIEIRGPGGQLLFSDADSLDGKNAYREFSAPETGTYTVSVLPESGQGEYVVSVDIAPQVVDVLIRSPSWSASFSTYLETEGLGADGFYRIPAGAQQLDALPWVGLREIRVLFSEDVTVSMSDLVLTGVNTSPYSFSEFIYDSSTFAATWTLDASIDIDALRINLSDAIVGANGGLALDGEWTDPSELLPNGDAFPSGNGTPGGDFHYRFNVLPCDCNQDGSVGQSDFGIFAFNYGSTLGANPFVGDFNGDTTVDQSDFGIFAARFGTAMPVGTPPILSQEVAGGGQQAYLSSIPVAGADSEVGGAGLVSGESGSPAESILNYPTGGASTSSRTLRRALESALTEFFYTSYGMADEELSLLAEDSIMTAVKRARR